MAFDLETTGLNPQKDSILEIGAVRVIGGRWAKEFSQLVDPGVPLPSPVVRLTGITPEQVRGMPPVAGVLPQFFRFVGELPLIAHNLPFDLSFLKEAAHQAGLDLPRFTGYDTLQLSRIALPTLRNHKLSTLASCYRLPSQGGHRALSDAQVVAQLFPLLLADLAHLPPQVISWLIKLTSKGPLNSLFQGLAGWATPPTVKDAKLFRDLSPQRLGRHIPPGGATSGANPLAKGITDAFDQSRFVLIGGVGGEFVWPQPVIGWAERSSARVVISASPSTLRDLPPLAQAVFVRGRDNYLCLKRFFTVLAEADLLLNEREREAILPLIVWANQTRSGDIAENFGFHRFHEYGLWRKLSARGGFCLGEKCGYYPRCWVINQEELSQEAKVILADHSLLCSDLTSDRPTLPPYRYLIAAEADDLERAATQSLRVEFNYEELSSILKELYIGGAREMGLLPLLIRGLKTAPSRGMLLHKVLALKGVVVAARRANKAFSSRLSQWALQKVGGQRGPQRIRYGPQWPLRDDPLAERLAQVGKELAEISAELSDGDKLKPFFQAQAADYGEITAQVNHLLHPKGEDWVWWVELRGKEPVAKLVSLPLNIAQRLKRSLYQNLSAGVFLSRGVDSSYLTQKLGLNLLRRGLTYYTLPSPSPSWALLLPSYLPPPGSDKFPEGVGHLIRGIGLRFRERVLSIFPSSRLLQLVYHQLTPWLWWDEVGLWAEGFDGPRSRVREALRSSPSVVLTTNSLWRAGDLLARLLILVKLPFPHPQEPLVEAKMEDWRKKGMDPFRSYLLPEVIDRWRRTLQGLMGGQDKGVILLLDRRLIERDYGELFLKGFPHKPVICGDEMMVMREIERWLD